MNSKQTIFITSIFVACGLQLVSAQAVAQSDNDPAWSITPYIWASDTRLDLAFRDTDIGGTEIKFSDAISTIDAALMLHAERGGKGNWSAFADLIYLKTSDTSERDLLTVDAQNKQTAIDVAVAYWPAGFGSRLNVFGGLRYSGFDDRYAFSRNDSPIAERRSSKDYYDALLGFRYRVDLTERWAFLTHADASFGDSEGTYLVRANFAYTVGKRQQNRIVFGYQYKEAEYRDSDLTTDFSIEGPMAGFNFRF